MWQQVVRVIDKELAHISPYIRNAVQSRPFPMLSMFHRAEKSNFLLKMRESIVDRIGTGPCTISSVFLTCSSSKFLQNLKKLPQLFVSELSQFDLIDVNI